MSLQVLSWPRFQLSDWQDCVASASSAGEFVIVFSGKTPEVFPERRLQVRVLDVRVCPLSQLFVRDGEGGAPVMGRWLYTRCGAPGVLSGVTLSRRDAGVSVGRQMPGSRLSGSRQTNNGSCRKQA